MKFVAFSAFINLNFIFPLNILVVIIHPPILENKLNQSNNHDNSK